MITLTSLSKIYRTNEIETVALENSVHFRTATFLANIQNISNLCFWHII